MGASRSGWGALTEAGASAGGGWPIWGAKVVEVVAPEGVAFTAAAGLLVWRREVRADRASRQP